MDDAHDESARCLIGMLDEEIRGRGWGAIRGVDRVVGRDRGWWQNRVKAGDLSVVQLLTVLDHLGIEPGRFLRKALGGEPGWELDRPRGEPPEIVVRAWERVRAGKEGKGVGRDYLDSLDERRYEEPWEVERLALQDVDDVELPLLPRLLGVAGSALRLLIRLDEAEHAIHAGIGISLEREDQMAVGDLLQRLAFVVADRGEYADALGIAERAAILYLRTGDRIGVAKALVDQGIWLYYLGRPQEAIIAFESALRDLPARATLHRFTALQDLGLCHQILGDVEKALRYLSAAEELTPNANAEGKLSWFRSSIHRDLGQLEEAESQLCRTVEIFRGLHHGEAALTTCDLVRIQLLRGRPGDAYLTATSMRALLEPLRHNKVISAALGDLLRCGQAGLTLALVEQVRARIESERKRKQAWQLLRIKQP
ncbi:MAG TPA: tetratricopeptide repeat protein [Thermoanaerobaculia bacterium]|jgi:tetratricopeptide (TPR) repeat protein